MLGPNAGVKTLYVFGCVYVGEWGVGKNRKAQNKQN